MKKQIERSWNDETMPTQIDATFGDGGKVSYRFDTLPEAIQRQLGVHGLEQKLFDSISGMGKKGETQAAMREHIGTVYAALEAGSWGTGRTASAVSPEVLALAVHRALGVPLDAATAKTAEWSVEQRKAVADNPSVKAEVTMIYAERAKERASAVPAVDAAAIKAMFA